MLVIEDGTVIEQANSYATLDEANDYFQLRGIDDWFVNPEENAAKLINAADYLNQAYLIRGAPVSIHQTMAFPTTAFFYVPQKIKTAQLILALEAKRNGDLLPSIKGAAIKKERKKLEGVGEKETEYVGSSTDRAYPSVDALVNGFAVTSIGSSIQSARRLMA